MAVSACGTTTSTGPPPSPPAATPTTASTSTVQTAQATVNGKALTILTDTQGRTLYYFTPDTAAKLACAGGWGQGLAPPLFSWSAAPIPLTSLPSNIDTPNAHHKRPRPYHGWSPLQPS